MKEKGFTLVELLAVIIILMVFSLVTVPLAMNTIETSKRNAFISSAKNALDATDLYTSKGGEVVFDGMSTQNLDIKKKDIYEGLVFVRTDDLKILKDFTDGNYCANGTKNDLQVTKGACKSTGLYPSVVAKLKEVTTKSATVEVEAEDSIGIESYSYCAEKCEDESSWVTTKEASHTFQNLTHHRLYELHIKVKNQIEHVTEEVIQASTFEVPAPTYVIEPSGWSRSKKVTITYPEAYDHYYQVTEGTVQVNGKTVAVGEKIKVKGTKVELTFQSNGRMNASVSDGYNEVTVNDLVLAQIDTENPVVTSASITSTNGNYNAVTTIISSVVSDNSGSLQMYISNSGYERGGSWEAYNSSKSWNVGGTLNGGTRTVYITYRDPAGNKVNKSLTYTVYKDCSNTTTTYGGWGACSKPCGGGTQTRSVTVKDKFTNKMCSTSTGSQACNTKSCDPVETLNPNDYEESKKVACNKDYFQRLIDRYFSKFQQGLNSQNFRNALYDCASVTQSIIRNSDAAYNALRSHPRTRIVSGQGSSAECTCYYNKDSKSAMKTCNKPACSQEHERFTSGNLYNGRILVLSATTSSKWPDWGTSSSKCGEDNGFGDCQNETSSVDKWGYRSILIGDVNNNVSEATGWGSCTKTTNAVINWNDCGSRDERKNRITYFQNGLRVGLYSYQDWYYWKSETQSRDKNNYKNGQVFVQIFVI